MAIGDEPKPSNHPAEEEVEDSEYESLEEKRDRLSKMKKEMEFRRDVLLEAIRDSRMKAQATGLYSDYKIARDVYEEELATFIKHSLS